MINLFTTIEKKIQALLEDGIDRLLHPGASHSVSAQLIALIQEDLSRQKRNEQKFAPDLIKLIVPTERRDAWQSLRETLDAVAMEIETSLSNQGYTFRHRPQIQLLSSPDLQLDEIRIITAYQLETEKTGQTSLLELHATPISNLIPKGACFIANSKDILTLNKQIVRIGRHSANDIVIQDPMVSREHLQLRAQQSRYLLFDLSSTGGTTINGQLVHNAVLKPGDVVRIGQTVLIYNQDLPDATTKTIVSVNKE